MSFVAACLALAAILQSVAAARYMGRLPDDRVAIGLYIASAVGFALASVGFCLARMKERRREEQEQLEEGGR